MTRTSRLADMGILARRLPVRTCRIIEPYAVSSKESIIADMCPYWFYPIPLSRVLSNHKRSVLYQDLVRTGKMSSVPNVLFLPNVNIGSLY